MTDGLEARCRQGWDPVERTQRHMHWLVSQDHPWIVVAHQVGHSENEVHIQNQLNGPGSTAFGESRIEQGHVPEESGAPIAIVHTSTGYRQYVVELSGQANHDGTHPMDLRRDPMGAAAEIIAGVIGIAHQRGRPAVTTVGRLGVEPNSRAIIPSRVTFTIDVRHPDQDQLRNLCSQYDALIVEVADRHGVSANKTD
jgi:acetylornithine deacetylase/succinyl-diaminopimelate desuccinylase-like protein